MEQKLQRARIAVFLLFLTNGALFANIVPRFPEIKDVFGLSDPAYGITIALFPLGSIVAGMSAAVLLRKFSSAVTSVIGTMVIGTTLTIAGLVVMWQQSQEQSATSPLGSWATYLLFCAFFATSGMADSITDVGQNAHGLRVQRLMGKPIINAFHGAWSVGAMLGGFMGSAAVALGIPLGWHMAGAAVIMVAVAFIARGMALPGADPARGEIDPVWENLDAAAVRESHGEVEEISIKTKSWGGIIVVTVLTLMCIGGMLVEDAASTWTTLYMRDHLMVVGGLAGAAYIVMLGSQAFGRFTADAVMKSWGPQRTVFFGGALIAVGVGAALAWQTVPVTLIAMFCAGFGCSSIVPIAMNAADDIPGLKPGTGLTVVTMLGRLAFLGAPPVVGVLVQTYGLTAALAVLPIAGVVVAATSAVIVPGKQHG